MTQSPADQLRAAKALSASMKAALPFLSADEPRTPYDLKRMGQKGGFTVLQALARRGLAREHQPGVGGIFSPHTTYRYSLTKLGESVRAITLAEQEDGNDG